MEEFLNFLVLAIEILWIGVELSMDAFAVSIGKGLASPKVTLKHMVVAGAWFGGFQALMPTLGYLLGSSFSSYINPYDHWIAFVLLTLIGGNMLREAFSKEEEEDNGSFGFKTMLIMAIATSIDALAAGVAFAMDDTPIVAAVISIGVITFLLSAVGVKLGRVVGDRFKSKAELIGGIMLIVMGIKILVEHLIDHGF